jgi:hypothetical protein
MAKPPALPPRAAPPTPPARSFNPQHSESRPLVPSNEQDAVSRIAERRRRGRPDTGAPAPGARPEVDPAAALGVTTPPPVPFSPLTGLATPPQPQPGTPAPQPGPQPGLVGGGLVELVINGQPTQVTLDELRRGYMRQQDYSAKTAAAAEQLKLAQTAHAQFDAVRVGMEQRLPQLIAGMADEFSQPIDWVKLAREDPIGYAQKDARHKQYIAAQQEQTNLRELRLREENNRKLEMKRLGHDFLAQVLPGWADPVSRGQLQALQTQHLQQVGYTPAEIEAYEALDPRQIVILEESRRFRVLVQAHPELLRTPEMHPENPQARGVVPGAMPGNGLLSSRDGGAIEESTAQQNWEAQRDQGGRQAREAAVSLIAARRQRRAGGGG